MSTRVPPPRSRRPELSFADIVRGVVVLAAGVLVVWWLGGLFRAETVVEPEPVGYVSLARQAQDSADFDLAFPPTLPAGWRATSARWDAAGQHWHLGILTADDEYVGIEQSDASVDAIVQEHAEEATAAGSVEVAGRSWRRFVDAADGEVTLVRRTGRASTLVTGTAPEPTVVALVADLHRP